MRKLLVAILLFGAKLLPAQNLERDLADAWQFYADNDFVAVHEIVDPLISTYPNQIELQFLMGWSSFQLPNHYRDAQFYLRKAAQQDFAKAHFWFGKLLFESNEIDSAEFYFKKSQDSTLIASAEKYLGYLMTAKTMMSEEQTVIVQPLGDSINSLFTEHSPLISWDDSILYFTSRRPMDEKSETDFNGQFDENIYFSKRNKIGWTAAEPLHGNINGLLNEATVSLLTSGNKMLIFQTARDFESSNLMWIEQRDGTWRESEKLPKPLNSESIEVGAAVNSNANVFIISSDREGGFGGFDLYSVVKFANGKYSKPVNLGPTVNTEFDERSPYLLQDDKTLYFSSDRPGSIGGLDIFSTQKLNAKEWSEPKNLGYPINSTSDDSHITISWKSGRAYFTRRSDENPNDFDIVSANLPGFNVSATVFKCQISSAEIVDFEACKITFKKHGSEEQMVLKSNNNGQFIVALLPGEKGVLKIEASGFETIKIPMVFETHEGVDEKEMNVILIQKAR